MQATQPDKGIYVELPIDLLKELSKRCRQSGWTRKAEIVLALRHWLRQPVEKNPAR